MFVEKNALLFSGQGSQYIGMGKELWENFDICKNILKTGNEILGFDICDYMWNKTEAELSKTSVSQPAILTVSLMALSAALEKGISASAVAGHSLGEYAAMYAAGILSLEDTYTAIKFRSLAMEKCANENPGGMAAVLGASNEIIEAACEEVCKSGCYVTPVNYNSNAQTVIAGDLEGLEKVSALLTEKGAKKIVKLAVSAAFHSKLMASASEEFKEKIKNMNFNAPKLAFYSNLNGEKLTNTSDMPSYLAKHVCSPVRFVTELNNMQSDGFDTFIEIGPGKVLTGLVKKTLSDISAFNIEDMKTLEKAIEN